MSERWSGVPENAERNGWHWLGVKGRSLRPESWIANPGHWALAGETFLPNEIAFTYHGPCHTSSDLAAARREERERAAQKLKAMAAEARGQALAWNGRDDDDARRWRLIYQNRAHDFIVAADAIEELPDDAAIRAMPEVK